MVSIGNQEFSVIHRSGLGIVRFLNIAINRTSVPSFREGYTVCGTDPHGSIPIIDMAPNIGAKPNESSGLRDEYDL
jgi:hypothetical protein